MYYWPLDQNAEDEMEIHNEIMENKEAPKVGNIAVMRNFKYTHVDRANTLPVTAKR